jgi:hypothetical protein
MQRGYATHLFSILFCLFIYFKFLSLPETHNAPEPQDEQSPQPNTDVSSIDEPQSQPDSDSPETSQSEEPKSPVISNKSPTEPSTPTSTSMPTHEVESPSKMVSPSSMAPPAMAMAPPKPSARPGMNLLQSTPPQATGGHIFSFFPFFLFVKFFFLFKINTNIKKFYSPTRQAGLCRRRHSSRYHTPTRRSSFGD